MVMGTLGLETDVVVVGGGPGGYVAALRLADLGKEVVLVEQREQFGGTCLIEGCIPSKTLLHGVELITAAREAEALGLSFSGLTVDPGKLREFTTSVIGGLTGGVRQLLHQRGVEMVRGRGRFTGPHELTVDGEHGATVSFQQAIVATGSRTIELPLAEGLDVWYSSDALRVPEIPERLVVIGGGYIGLELGLVYAGLGSQVTVVESLPELLVAADKDLVRVLKKSCEDRFSELLQATTVRRIQRQDEAFAVTVEHEGGTRVLETDRVLVSVGRRPNTEELGLEHVGLQTDAQGRIPVDEQMRTAAPQVFAIGDVAPGPMLAHKASREGKVAAEAIAGQPSAFDNRAVPAVVFTDPQLAWTGLTETEAREQGLEIRVGRFPLKALGRARTIGRSDGLVKVIAEAGSNLVLGVGMVGPGVSELMGDATLAIEMGATLEDLMVTIHPHPTMSEALQEAAEVAAGQPTHIAGKQIA